MSETRIVKTLKGERILEFNGSFIIVPIGRLNKADEKGIELDEFTKAEIEWLKRNDKAEEIFKSEEEALSFIESRERGLEKIMKAHTGFEEAEVLEAKKNKSIRKIKTGQYLFSSGSYDYLLLKTKKGEGIVKLPRFKAKQDLLIDFIFTCLKKQWDSLPANSPDRCEIVSYDDFNMVLTNSDKYPPAFTGFSFTTTEVRAAIGIRKYKEEDMIEDFKKIRDSRIEAKSVKVWAEEGGGYKRTINWSGSIISDVVDTKTERIIPKTGEPLHRIHVCLGLITGLLWRNDIYRKKYSLFLIDTDEQKSFNRLPWPCQKIFRYLSLWKESTLNLEQFSDILNYRPTGKQLRKFKARIDKYLGILKERGFIYYYERLKGTRGWKTQWYILRVKNPNTE